MFFEKKENLEINFNEAKEIIKFLPKEKEVYERVNNFIKRKQDEIDNPSEEELIKRFLKKTGNELTGLESFAYIERDGEFYVYISYPPYPIGIEKAIVCNVEDVIKQNDNFKYMKFKPDSTFSLMSPLENFSRLFKEVDEKKEIKKILFLTK